MPLKLNHMHHVAIICSDYEQSLHFYTKVLGLELIAQHYRESRQSWKADLALNGQYVVELFSFPSPPPRPSWPEAAGLRHLAFAVGNLEATIAQLDADGVPHESPRTDEYTGLRFLFLSDPDGLPIELYEE